MTSSLKNLSLKENKTHGNFNFPCALYQTDSFKEKGVFTFHVEHHWQDELELIHFEKGHFKIDIDMNDYEIEDECFCFIRGGEIHAIFAEHEFIEQALVFDASLLDLKAQNDVIFPRFLYPNQPAFQDVYKEFCTIKNIFYKEPTFFPLTLTLDDYPSQLRIKASLFNILATLEEQHLITHTSPAYDQRAEILKTIISYIHTHYQDKIYLHDLADIANMNEQYFCRFFKTHLGKSPINYINIYRLRQACELLQHTSLPITEICLECGFNNLSHFTKEFKKHMHTTPLQYKKNILSIK